MGKSTAGDRRAGRRRRAGNSTAAHRACMFATVLLMAFIWAAPSIESHGAENRIVRVGFFPMNGYNETQEDGTRTGMDVEYLENLCDYLDWEIEYVDCESWDGALQMLYDKEVDLVGSAQYSAERAEKYEYASLASGYTFGTIAVEGTSPIAYEDFDIMSDITYGIVRTYVRKDEFYEYLAGHGIHRPKVIEYEDTASLQEALAKGEIDALVHSLTEVREGQRVIGRFAPMPIYYISWQGNDDVMLELNQGIADIKMNRPELENELMVKYYDNRLSQTVLLTREEKNYIEEKKELTVGYLDGYYPFSYEDDGEYAGLARQALEEISVSTGVMFTYVEMEDMAEVKEALADGSIDILSYCGESAASMREAGAALTNAYASAPHVLIMKTNSKADAIRTLAVAQDGNTEGGISDFIEGDTEIVPYKTQLECLEAVKSGKADAAVCDGYLGEYLLGAEYKFSDMEIHGVLSDTHSIYMAVKDDAASPLLNILNKELIGISDKMVSDYMLQDNFYSKMSIGSFLRKYGFIFLLVICAVAFYMVYSLRAKLKDSRRIEQLMYMDADFPIKNLNFLKYQASLKLAEKKKENYAIVYMGVRQFRNYNTLYGWDTAQYLLQVIIQIIQEEMDREKELYARNYGDHFVLFIQYKDMDALTERLEKLEKKISDQIFEEVHIRMTVMMGVCCLDNAETSVQSALSNSTQAMNMLKEESNSIQFYDEALHNRLMEQYDREKMLYLVDVGECFVAWYQAKVDIRNGLIVGAEALARFKDPQDNGAIKPPGYFIPYFERTGRVTEIDFAVLEDVCAMMRRRLDEGKPVVPVSCNFSRTHFIKDGFPEKFREVLERYRVPKELIEVEITETIVMEEFQKQKVKETMDILHENGVRLSIDDFGSGYSSLGVFEQIPASVIKLDRSFLLNKEDHAKQVKIMKNIVHMAEDLEAQIVCEGVETKQDKEVMMEIGAYIAQGYRYSKPVSEEIFEGMLDRKCVQEPEEERERSA